MSTPLHGSFVGEVAIALLSPTVMTHIAIQEILDDKPVGWMEQVSNEQYQSPNVNQ